VDPRAVLDAVVKRKIPSPRRKSNPRTPTVIKYKSLTPMIRVQDRKRLEEEHMRFRTKEITDFDRQN
jgi:hypothetical protein